MYTILYNETNLEIIDKETREAWTNSRNTNYFYGLIMPSLIIEEYYANKFDYEAMVNERKIAESNSRSHGFHVRPNKAAPKEIKKQIQDRIKDGLYTSALVSIVHYLSSERFLLGDWSIKLDGSIIEYPNIAQLDFKYLSFIGDLLLDMMVGNSCFLLYSIDGNLFHNPKSLGLLVESAIKSGDLEKSKELLAKLIDSEPYHPSVLILKSEIKRLEHRNSLKINLSIDFSSINNLSGLEFEKLLYDKFLELGFKVEFTPKTGDFGADLIIENNEGTRIAVQCKRFTSKVNLKAVQEVIGAIGYYCCDMGIVITNNSFLNSAVKLAESHDVELWDGDKLISFLAGDLSFSKIVGN